MAGLVEDADMKAQFAQDFGAQPGGAADLIRDHFGSIDPAVEAASRKAVDEEATSGLDFDKIKPARGGFVLDAAVRGDKRTGQFIVYVAEDASGYTYKGVAPLGNAELRGVSPGRVAVHDQYLASREQNARVQQAMDDFEKQMEAKRRELQAELNADIAKANEAGAKAQAKANDEKQDGAPAGGSSKPAAGAAKS